MKHLILTVSLLACSAPLYSQDSLNQHQQEYFIVLYTVGEDWDTTKQYQEQLYASEHSAHLNKLRKTNIISMGARYNDTGMIILKANNLSEAQKIINEDPAMQNKMFRIEIYPFYPFYDGCIE